MKFTAFTFLFLLSSLTLASELVLVEDGSRARCENKFDVSTDNSKLIFSVKNPSYYLEENTVKLDIDMYFYECREINKGEFKLVEVDFKTSHEIKAPSGLNLIVEYSNASLRAYNESYKSIDTAKVGEVVGLSIPLEDLDINNFKGLQYKGEFYVNLDLTMLRKIKTDTYDSGNSIISSGSFRLFIDLDRAEVSL